MKSNKYWENRSAQRMYEYIKDADKVADEIGKAYLRAAKYLEERAKRIFDTYKLKSGLSGAEAKRILKNIGNETNYDTLKKAFNRVSDPDIKKMLLNQLNAPAYRARIERVQQLQKELEKKCNELYRIENKAVEKHLNYTAQNAYYRTIYDVQIGTGYGFGFAQISDEKTNEIVRNNWSGAAYSTRIWNNTQTVANLVKDELFLEFLTGKSQHDMSAAIMEKMGVGAMRARRLVRTESCYVANQAEMESYKECGVERYRFVATLDLRTSKICAEMDDKEFFVAEQQPGKNCPPMHPNCRSTTVAVINDEIEKEAQRRARDPKTGKNVIIPGNMTYKEWYGKYVDGDNTVQYIKIGNVTTATQSTADEIYRQINLLPAAHKSIIENEVKEIKIVSEGTSNFNRVTKVMSILENPDPHEVIHECAHVIEGKLGLIDGKNEKYNALRESVVKGKGYGDVYWDRESRVEPFLKLQSDRFVSEYQGYLYSGGKEGYEMIIDEQVNPKCLVEYFSEGYSFYLAKPEVLREKDRKLFNFIKELTGG